MPATSPLTEITLHSPLSVAWSEQYARLHVPGLEAGKPAALLIDEVPADFQYTGAADERGAEVLVRLGFEKDQQRHLVFHDAPTCTTDLRATQLADDEAHDIGVAQRPLIVPVATTNEAALGGPFIRFADHALYGRVHCDAALAARRLTRTNDGPLFIEHELSYAFTDGATYRLTLRSYRHEPMVEVAETFNLGPGAALELVLNPTGRFDRFMTHRGFDFESEAQPIVSALAEARAGDVLCRLQMPPLGEYVGHNNRGWFALFNEAQRERGMLGMLGLHGARWTEPVANMMHVAVDEGRARLRASLASGRRYWALYAGPVETEYEPGRRLVFHRLHGEFNAARLDEHLDLNGRDVFDTSCADRPALFGADFRNTVRRNVVALPCLARSLEEGRDATWQALLDGTPRQHQPLIDELSERLDLWVRQFQGYRTGAKDYAKSVIGFARRLRELLVGYELLRKDGALDDEQIGRLHACFVFAARRIIDEGRWPHSRTWLHPDHPDSVRDLYTYGGEHRPDRLVWTNSLPNFQSDPMCALLHVSCIIPEHPDADAWRSFALDDLERQLDAYCGDSGAWEESINYALFTLSYFIVTFRVLKHRAGIDYFQDARVRRFVGWLARFFGPYDKRFDSYTWPAIGNSKLPANQGELLLAYVSELAAADPLRESLIAVYQACADKQPANMHAHFTVPLAAMAEPPGGDVPMPPLGSEHMDEVGVAMRHRHPHDDQSYLFQKIGFFKDHYENDETAINWYARGTPLVMDYGTYTPDAAVAGAHNVVEVPDQDSLRRGYLADHVFTEALDYTRCEVPVTLKLLHGRMRTFEEIDGPRVEPAYFYLGDENPVGPKVWKTRLLVFVKPDYVVLFDRIVGGVPHRYNLHATVDAFEREGAHIHGRGRFDLDLRVFVQHPQVFEYEDGLLVPGPGKYGEGEANPHRQRFFRLYNTQDDRYRTVLFAQQRGGSVTIAPAGEVGVRVETPQYTDYVFVNDQRLTTRVEQGVAFRGRVGWMRRWTDGAVQACVPDGEWIEAFGRRIEGRGPWTLDIGDSTPRPLAGPPRRTA
ncbi:MAG: hypothetical protein ACODAQ_01425 [Phycisphaeraceae bacterium]